MKRFDTRKALLNTPSLSSKMNQTPEEKAREKIDKMLDLAGWQVQDKDKIDFHAGQGIAVREYQAGKGRADYVLFLGRGNPVGIIEAKKEEEGERLNQHQDQALRYAKSRVKWIENKEPLPFVYLSTGLKTTFCDLRDPKPRFREVFAFHSPETLKKWVKQNSLRSRLLDLPELDADGLRNCQTRAVNNLEQSFKLARPRALIQMATGSGKTFPEKTIADPAAGTGGFFLAAYDYLLKSRKLDRDQNKFLKSKTFFGNEIVQNTRRLALMNMFLHNIGDIAGQSMIVSDDALLSKPKESFDYVLTNPPFGKKSSHTFTNEEGKQEKEDLTYERQDFWATTSNKQLNFVQHICSMLKITGQAAVVVPDNVLFEGGAGETIRKKLLDTTALHTVLRLPTGVFYKQGVKANVIFFDNKPGSPNPWTKEVWFYDFRTNRHFTLKKNPLKSEDLKDFIDCYKPKNRHKRAETWSEDNQEGRWRKFSYQDIISRDKTSLDIFWLKDKSLTDLDNLPEPDILAAEIIENLEAGLNSFKDIVESLNGGN